MKIYRKSETEPSDLWYGSSFVAFNNKDSGVLCTLLVSH